MSKLDALLLRTVVYVLILGVVGVALKVLTRVSDEGDRRAGDGADSPGGQVILTFPAVVTLTLPDGESVEVKRVRSPLPPQSAIGRPKLSSGYAALRKAAESGDGAAAYFLGAELQNCGWYAKRSEEELGAWIEELTSTRLYRAPLQREAVLVDQPILDALIEGHRRAYADCGSIRAEEIQAYPEWLALAADAGHVGAQHAYLDVSADLVWRGADPGSPEVLEAFALAVGFLERARDAGSAAAMGELAALFGTGRTPSPDEQFAGVHAYAHFLAAEKVYEAHGDSCCARAAETAAEALTPAQRAAAVGLTRTLLASPNCCFRE